MRFALRTDEPDRDYFTLGFKAATEVGSGGSAYFLYEALLAHSHLDTHTFEVGLRLQY